MAKYLDNTGVQTLWNKCKDTFGTVKTVNGNSPDANGNVVVTGGSSLPTFDTTKAGYVLGVDNSGQLVWIAPYNGAATGS